jgi:hypothetical protein
MLTPAEAKIHDEIFYYEYLATLESVRLEPNLSALALTRQGARIPIQSQSRKKP